MTYNFEKLEIWQLSLQFSCDIYKTTSDFPLEEKYGITNQLRRAIASVSANIAEGSARLGDKDRAHFIQIAYSSLMEVLSFLIMSEKLCLIDLELYDSYRDKLDKLANKINAYYRQIKV